MLRAMLRQSAGAAAGGAGAAAGGAGAAAPAADMNTLSTVGVDLASLDVRVPENGGSSTVRLQLWDTAGQEKYRSIAESFYRGAAGIILVYDVTRRETFLSFERWLASITANTAIGNLELVLVGNKADLVASAPGARAVTEAAGREAAAALDMPHFEASALTGANVAAAVETLAARLLARARSAATAEPSRTGFAPVDFVSLAERAEAPRVAAGGCDC